MTDASEMLGQTIDRLDNLTHALSLTLMADFHLTRMRVALPEIVADLKKYYAAVTGENPWEGGP